MDAQRNFFLRPQRRGTRTEIPNHPRRQRNLSFVRSTSDKKSEKSDYGIELQRMIFVYRDRNRRQSSFV